FDVRHSFNASVLYELPYGRGRRYGSGAPMLANMLLGGWQLGGIVNARSGLPIEVLITRPDIIYRDTRNGTFVNAPILAGGVPVPTPVINVPGGGASRNVRRPDVVPGVSPYFQQGGLQFVNPAAFATPQPGTFGNLGRDALHGPNLAQLDLTLDKR